MAMDAKELGEKLKLTQEELDALRAKLAEAQADSEKLVKSLTDLKGSFEELSEVKSAAGKSKVEEFTEKVGKIWKEVTAGYDGIKGSVVEDIVNSRKKPAEDFFKDKMVAFAVKKEAVDFAALKEMAKTVGDIAKEVEDYSAKAAQEVAERQEAEKAVDAELVTNLVEKKKAVDAAYDDPNRSIPPDTKDPDEAKDRKEYDLALGNAEKELLKLYLSSPKDQRTRIAKQLEDAGLSASYLADLEESHKEYADSLAKPKSADEIAAEKKADEAAIAELARLHEDVAKASEDPFYGPAKDDDTKEIKKAHEMALLEYNRANAEFMDVYRNMPQEQRDRIGEELKDKHGIDVDSFEKSIASANSNVDKAEDAAEDASKKKAALTKEDEKLIEQLVAQNNMVNELRGREDFYIPVEKGTSKEDLAKLDAANAAVSNAEANLLTTYADISPEQRGRIADALKERGFPIDNAEEYLQSEEYVKVTGKSNPAVASGSDVKKANITASKGAKHEVSIAGLVKVADKLNDGLEPGDIETLRLHAKNLGYEGKGDDILDRAVDGQHYLVTSVSRQMAKTIAKVTADDNVTDAEKAQLRDEFLKAVGGRGNLRSLDQMDDAKWADAKGISAQEVNGYLAQMGIDVEGRGS